MNIYVGNLPFETTEDDLKTAFEAHGEVTSVQVIVDKFTGRSRGFAFVEMSDDAGGEAAIEQLDNVDFGGRQLKVTQANRKEGGPPPRD